MNTQTDLVSIESIQRQLPFVLRDAPLQQQVAYIRRKRRQFMFLFWLGIGMAGLLVLLTIITFFLPDLDPEDNLIMSMIIVALFTGASFGNRKMAQRYAEFESRLKMEDGKE